MEKRTEKFAKIISYIFNPLLMPSLGLLMIFNSGTYLSYLPFEAKRLIFLVIFSGTFIIPASFIPIFIYFKIINEVEVESASQRIIPLVLTGVIYFCTFYMLRAMPVPFINIFILSTMMCILINAIIIIKWKISSHLIGIGGLTGLAIGLFIRMNADIAYFLIALILIAGFLGYARLRLRMHTPAQIYTGFLLGFAIVCTMMLL